MTRYLETSAGFVGRVRSAFGLVALIAAAAALPSCSTRGVQAGGESNWLETCDTDAACGELGACRCGICTSDCSVTADCNGYEDATCADGEAADAQCADSAAVTSVCLPTCNGARPCPNEQECVDGACTLTSTTMGQGGAGSTDGGGSGGPGGGAGGSGGGAGGSGPSFDNPSGNCTGPIDGGRIDGIHGGLAVSDQYVPDCQLELAREYYTVFRNEDGTANMIPRPDGNPALFAPCTDSGHELAGIVERYGLCESAQTEAAVDIVNAMDLADALTVAHHLHAQLVFYPSSGNGINLPPRDSDVLAACKVDAEFRAGPLTERCDFELMYENSGRPGVAFIYDDEQGYALSVKLNEIYGISGGELDASMDPVCDRLGASAEAVVYAAALEADRSCTTDEDCVLSQSTPCFDAGQCGVSVAVSDTTTLDEAFATIEGGQCGFFADLGCEAPGLAPCSFAQPVCRDNVCE